MSDFAKNSSNKAVRLIKQMKNMDNKLEKYGEYLLNPDQVTEIKFESNKAVIYLSDGRVREVFGAEALALKDRFGIKVEAESLRKKTI